MGKAFCSVLLILLTVSGLCELNGASAQEPTGPVRASLPLPNPLQGKASWYGRGHIGRRTANGEIFTAQGFTAAHPDLPLGSLVRVVNLRNQRSVIVRINDRGPYVPGRIIDLSERAAHDLRMTDAGVVEVRLELLRRG